MGDCKCGKIIDTIKVIARIEGVQANNALTLDPLIGTLQFGGPLIKDTVVNGNYNLSFGSFGNNIKYFSVSSNTTVYLEANNGVVGSFINIENNRILIGSSSPTSGGLMGLHNYTAGQNDGRYYAQRIFVDNHIAGKPVVSAVANPGPTEHTKSIAWNNDIGMWTMQAAGAAPSAGNPTQVIYNDAGALVGHENFTFTPITNFLSVPSISLGHALLGGNYRYLTAQGSEAVISILFQPKGTGSIVLGAYTGAILLGADNSPNTVQRLMARGAGAQVDIALETKGTEGKVFIGDKDEVGAYRRIQARGYNPSISLLLHSKGQGDIILDADPDATTGGGMVKIGIGSSFANGVVTKKLYANSDYITTNLEIGGDGSGFILSVGVSHQNVSNRFLTVGSSAADCNLNIYGKGAGRVFVDGVATKKIAIGSWNMDAVAGGAKDVPHGLADRRKILSIYVMILNDAGNNIYPLDLVTTTDGIARGGGVWGIDSTSISLSRMPTPNGFFDNSSFASTAVNRGWVYITYEL